MQFSTKKLFVLNNLDLKNKKIEHQCEIMCAKKKKNKKNLYTEFQNILYTYTEVLCDLNIKIK